MTNPQVFHDAFEHAFDASLITGGNGQIFAANEECARLTGQNQADLVGRKPESLGSERYDTGFHTALREQLASTGEWRGLIWWQRKNEADCLLATTVSRISSDADGESHLWILRRPADRSGELDENEYLASHDLQTRLPNRLLLVDRLRRVCTRVKRSGGHAALMILEIEWRVDPAELGPAITDRLVAQAAERLQRNVRESDTVARLDIKEFAIILNEITDSGDADRVAHTLIGRLTPEFVVDNRSISLSTNFGITVIPTDGTVWTRVIRNADLALAEARKTGRSPIRFSAD